MPDSPQHEPSPGSARESGTAHSEGRIRAAVASLVLAAASLPASLFVGFGLIFAIPAIALGVFGLSSEKRNLALSGILLGSIGAAVSLASIILVFMLARSTP